MEGIVSKFFSNAIPISEPNGYFDREPDGQSLPIGHTNCKTYFSTLDVVNQGSVNAPGTHEGCHYISRSERLKM